VTGSHSHAFDLAAAVTRNRFWASTRRKVVHGPKRLVWQGQGWGPLYGAIAAWMFGEYDPPPSPERFAHLVADWQREQAGLAVNGVLSRTPWRKMLAQTAHGIPADYTSPVNGLLRPHGWAQVVDTFGDPGPLGRTVWEEHYIGAVRAPGLRSFMLADGSQARYLRLHRALVPHAEAFFAAVARGGLWDELQPVGRAYEWDPAAERLHTWGIALDLRPEQYQAASRPRSYPDPEHYPPGYLLRHIQAFGWQWGLWFESPHPGHLQFATGVEGC
jgi:hypothetical protein